MSGPFGRRLGSMAITIKVASAYDYQLLVIMALRIGGNAGVLVQCP